MKRPVAAKLLICESQSPFVSEYRRVVVGLPWKIPIAFASRSHSAGISGTAWCREHRHDPVLL